MIACVFLETLASVAQKAGFAVQVRSLMITFAGFRPSMPDGGRAEL